jgi:uncharacterized membrane protein
MKLFGRTATLARALPWILIIGGVIGILSSAVITYDELQMAKDPSYSPGCDINPVVGCGSVTQSDQGHVFGFSNPYLGLVGFAVVLTTGVVLLAGAKLKRWYWLGLQMGVLLGVIFIHWLIFQSLYVIGSLCPYCMAVWAAMITMFWYVTLYNIQLGNIRLKGWLQKAAYFARRHHLDILGLWLLIIAVLILKRFWYYYGDKVL